MFFYDPLVKEVAPFDTHGRGVREELDETEIEDLRDAAYARMKEIILGISGQNNPVGSPFEAFAKYNGEIWKLVADFVLASEAL